MPHIPSSRILFCLLVFAVMIISKPFFYIRHGETDWNAERRYQGSIDIPLNATGEQQATDAVAGLSGQGITQIFSSPLKRARRTADIMNAELNLPLTEIPTLQECNFGVKEGTIRQGDSFSDKWRAGETPDKAETYQAFKARVFDSLNQVLSHDSVPLVVAHGAVFWPLHEFTNIPLVGTLPNARAIYVFPKDDGWDYTQL